MEDQHIALPGTTEHVDTVHLVQRTGIGQPMVDCQQAETLHFSTGTKTKVI